MGISDGTGTKKRKVHFDEYSGGFYAESKVEALQRQCDYRARLTEVINKAEEAKYKFACKQVDAEKQIFLMKKERADHRHQENLQDHKAHLSVLEKLAREREKTMLEDDLFGKYPPNSIRNRLDELIIDEIKELSPVTQRRKEAHKLLEKRNEMPDVNRTMSTDDLFFKLKSRQSRASSPAKSSTAPAHSTRKSMPKLILPAITVKLTKDGTRPKVTDSVSIGKNKDKSTANVKKSNDKSAFPSLFITDPKSHTMPLR